VISPQTRHERHAWKWAGRFVEKHIDLPKVIRQKMFVAAVLSQTDLNKMYIDTFQNMVADIRKKIE
jgi:hypothetical protein